MKILRMLIVMLVCSVLFNVIGQAENKYVGVKACAMCHKTEKQGNQLAIWQKSKHAEAYKSLTTVKADSIAKARGLTKSASESPECLKCHVIGYDGSADLLDKNYDYKDGVQCETCHGAGSGYKTLAIMKDKAKSVAAGLQLYKDDAEIEKFCVTCHNDKSPMYKGFKIKEMWGKIKHPKPKT